MVRSMSKNSSILVEIYVQIIANFPVFTYSCGGKQKNGDAWQAVNLGVSIELLR